MRMDGGGRRGFLKSAGLVVPGLALAGELPLRQAQQAFCRKGAAEMGHPERSFVPAFYDVRAFGAAGDGKTIDTPAINQAIGAAAAGGGNGLFSGWKLFVLFDPSQE